MNYKYLKEISAIYILINLINNKIYIGKSNNLRERIKSHLYKCSNKRLIDIKLKEYGSEFFKLEILHYWETPPDINEMLALETAFIDEYKSLVQFGNGYNICLFGNDMTGTHHSKKTRQKISSSHSGENNFMFGKKHNEQTKKLMSIRAKSRDNSYKLKKIKQINKNTNQVIKIWNSIREASKELNISRSNISDNCAKRIKTCGGFKWEYINQQPHQN